MNRTYGDSIYVTAPKTDRAKGYAGLELYRMKNEKRERIATVLFWDSCGQFYVETFNSDVPLDILEEMIRETKKTIKVS